MKQEYKEHLRNAIHQAIAKLTLSNDGGYETLDNKIIFIKDGLCYSAYKGDYLGSPQQLSYDECYEMIKKDCTERLKEDVFSHAVKLTLSGMITKDRELNDD